MKPKFTYPDWFTPEIIDAFEDYLTMRKLRKYVLTDRSKRGLINKLELFKNESYDIVKVIDRATLGNWQSFYRIDEAKIEREYYKPPETPRSGKVMGMSELADELKKRKII